MAGKKYMQAINSHRTKYLLIASILFLVCVAIVLFFPSGIIRTFVGDMVIIGLLWSFLKIFLPRLESKYLIGLWLFAVGVEVLQYFNIVEILGLESSRLARIIIGTTFDPWDVLAYSFGAIIVYLFENSLKNCHSGRSQVIIS